MPKLVKRNQEQQRHPIQLLSVLDEALKLHAAGLWVVPQVGKRAIALGWQQFRLADIDLEEYLGGTQDLNIAIALNQSEVIDVECDSPDAEARFGELCPADPVTPTWRSRRGLHRLFRRPDPKDMPDKAKVEVEGIEFRLGGGGKGALSTVPPSVHPDDPACVYRWLPGRSIHECQPAPLPDALATLLRKAAKSRAKRTDAGDAPEVGVIPEGHRNDELYRMGCRALRSVGIDQMPALLHGENKLRCDPPLPDSEVDGIVASVQATAERAKTDIAPRRCHRWADVQAAWQDALEWRQGLEDALATMLAVAASTSQGGKNQLFLQIVGAPGCLDGSTPIYDPVDGTTRTVRERWERRESFFVYTNKGGRLGVAQALPPRKYAPTPLYRVTFASGRQITVTAGHRFWDGSAYVSLTALLESGAYRLPTIEEPDLSTRARDALRSTRTVEGCRYGCQLCSCSCGGQPLPAASTGRCVSPLPVCAPTRSSLRRAGDLAGKEEHTPCTSSARPANTDCWSRLSAVDGWRSQPDGHTGQSSWLCDRAAESTAEGPLPTGTFRQSETPRLPIASVGEAPSVRAPRCTCPPRTGTPRPLEPCFSLTGRSGNTERSSPPAQVSACGYVPAFVSQPRPPEGNASAQPTPSASSGTPRLGCVPMRTEIWPVVPETETSLPSLPYRAPVSVCDLDIGAQCIVENTDAIVKVEAVGTDHYYDFCVPETNNYWAVGLFHHNSGKTEMSQALLVSPRCKRVERLNGIFSGMKDFEDPDKDFSFLARANHMTWVTPEMDLLMSAPGYAEVMSQMRRVFDGSASTTYKNRDHDMEYNGLRTPWIQAGTHAMVDRRQASLGDRFLRIYIDDPDTDTRKRILKKVGLTELDAMMIESNCAPESSVPPRLLRAYQLTGGYVDWLRDNVTARLRGIARHPDYDADKLLEWCRHHADFVAHMRSCPPDLHYGQEPDYHATKELPSRLQGQFVRLAMHLAVALQRPHPDADVLRIVKRVALDTARGRALTLTLKLARAGIDGTGPEMLANAAREDPTKTKRWLTHMQKVGVVARVPGVPLGQAPRWRLTRDMQALYREVVGDAEAR